jgi:hypothetical protein
VAPARFAIPTCSTRITVPAPTVSPRCLAAAATASSASTSAGRWIGNSTAVTPAAQARVARARLFSAPMPRMITMTCVVANSRSNHSSDELTNPPSTART